MPNFMATLSARLAKHTSQADERGCCLWTGSVDKDGYGRVRVKWPGGVSKIHRVARVVFRLKLGGREVPQSRVSDGRVVPLDVSHLCHQRLCMTPEHLVLEPKAVNSERTHCVRQGHCSHHGEHPDCLFVPRNR